MKKNYLIILLLFVCFRGYSTLHTISFGSFFYSPNNLTVNVGDTVRWSGSFTTHPLASTAVPSGAATFSNSSGTVFNYVITVAGTYTYACQNHSSMTGVIIALNSSGVNQVTNSDSGPAIMVDDNSISIISPGNNPSDYSIEIISLLGNLSYENKFGNSQNELQIDTRELTPGIYFVRITEDKKVYGKKIVIAR
jgi:hypothetical protein